MTRLRSFQRFFLPLFALACSCLHAADPADSQIKGALYDIEKYEQQFSGNAAVNASTVNRSLKLLTLTRQRLDSSGNKSHESWIDANSRLIALIASLEARLAPSASAPAATAQPAPSRPAPSARPASSAPAQMISQQRVRIQKLARDVDSATQTLDQNGPKPFQDSEYVAGRIASLERFREALSKYAEFAGDSDVVAAENAISKYANMIAFGQKHAAQEQASTGDVQAQLRALDNQLKGVPPPPEHPYAGTSLNDWIITIAQSRQLAETALQQLVPIREKAYLPNNPGTVGQGSPYDMQDVSRLEHGFRGNVSKIDALLETFKGNLDNQVSHISDTLDFVAGLEPSSEKDQANSFLAKGSADEIRRRLADERHLASTAVAFDKMLGRPELAAHNAMLARIESTATGYEANLAKARKLVRLPKAASTDKALHAIVKDTLSRPDYEASASKRTVINSDKVHREMETSEAEIDKVDVSLSGKITMSGTQTTYKYSWDQFQAATVERDGGAYYIFYNTFKYYTSGAPTTPLNKWILAARIQSSEIPEANINLD